MQRKKTRIHWSLKNIFARQTQLDEMDFSIFVKYSKLNWEMRKLWMTDKIWIAVNRIEAMICAEKERKERWIWALWDIHGLGFQFQIRFESERRVFSSCISHVFPIDLHVALQWICLSNESTNRNRLDAFEKFDSYTKADKVEWQKERRRQKKREIKKMEREGGQKWFYLR